MHRNINRFYPATAILPLDAAIVSNDIELFKIELRPRKLDKIHTVARKVTKETT